MHEILFFGVIFGGIFSLFSSLILVHMGMLIDRFPVGDEEKRERSIWSPREFTRYAVMIYWPMYFAGAAMLVPGTRIMTVAGIATLFGLILFLITALIFSGATYNLMRAQGKGSGSPMATGSMIRPESILRAFRLPVQGRKIPSSRVSQASRTAAAEE